jgi:hypothetical protein
MKIFLVFLWLATASAATDTVMELPFEDNFDSYQTNAEMVDVWDSYCPYYTPVMQLENLFSHSSSKAVTSTLNNPTNDDNGSCYMNRFYKPATEVYYRWYQYFDKNWVGNSVTGSKLMYHKVTGGTGPLIVWHIIYGDNGTPGDQIMASIYSNGIVPCGSDYPNTEDSNCFIYPNMNESMSHLKTEHWYCIETRAKFGSGKKDGEIDIWIDGTQVLRRNDVWLNLPGDTAQGWGEITYYAQMGKGTRYLDDVAVSTTKIGCGSMPPAPPPSPTKPAAPKNLRVM